MFPTYGNSNGLWQQQGRVPTTGQPVQQQYQYANGLFPLGGGMAHHQQQQQHNILLQQQQQQQQQQQASSQTFLAATSARPASGLVGSMGSTSASSPGFGLMLPPTLMGSGGGARGGQLERAEERGQAAQMRRQEQAERQQRERAMHEQGSVNLFDRPEKVQSDNSSVASVLGDYSNAQRIINSHSSCIGIDYQPPTPAPVQHFIGDDEEESQTRPQRRPPPTIPRPPSHQRLPDNLNMTHRPAKPNRPNNSAVAASAAAASGYGNGYLQQQQMQIQQQQQQLHQQRLLQHQQQRFQQQRQQQLLAEREGSFSIPSSNGRSFNVSRMKQASQSLPKLNTDPGDDDASLQEILREMKDPLFSEGKMPAPLSAIFTPKIANHEGNSSRLGVPKYFSGMPPSFPATKSNELPTEEEKRPANVVPSMIMSSENASASVLKQSADAKFVNGAALPLSLRVRDVRLSESDSEDEKHTRKNTFQQQLMQTSQFNPMTKDIKPSPPPPRIAVPSPPPQSQQLPKTSNSSSDSSSDSDSDSEDESNHSSSDPDAKTQHQDEFSLGNLLGKVKSTHSPGPNPHPSPRVMQQLSSVKMCPDDEQGISELLSHTPQPLPDLVDPSVLDGHDLLASLGQPLSPLEPSTPSPKPARATPRRSATAVQQGRTVTRRQSSTRQSLSSFQDSSDDDNMLSAAPSKKPRRPPRKPKVQQPPPPQPAPQQLRRDPPPSIPPVSVGSKKSWKRPPESRKQPPKQLSRAYVSNSSGDDSDQSNVGKRVPAFSAAPKAEKLDSEDSSPGSNRLRHDSNSVAAAKKRHDKSRVRAGDNELRVESNGGSDSPRNMSSVKKQFISKIFASKSSTKSNSAGGKGGKGGKSGITVERVLHVVKKEYPPPRRRGDGRPYLVCRIPLVSLSMANALLKESCNSRARRQSGGSISSSSSKRSRRSEREDSKRKRTSENEEAGGFDDYFDRRKSSVTPSANAGSAGEDGRPFLGNGTSSGSQRGSTPGATGSWATMGANLMPPPTKMFYSYLEHRGLCEEDDADEDVTTYMSQAKRLKHEADRETDRERQAMKYLQAVLFFILCGNLQEQRGDKNAAFTMYKETLSLIKHVCRPFRNSDVGNFDNKLAVLSLRCQSLMYLKLYKMCRHELKECQKIIGDHIQKATASQQSSPVNQTTISPTPSPAGSEGSVCSKSSGYTSAGELPVTRLGVLTPPTVQPLLMPTLQPMVCLSVPQSVMQKQHLYCNYLSQCHELWEMADVYAHKGHCEDFIIRLDQTCGPLTLHSSLKDLVKYTQSGLDYLS